ncbi:Addiction module antidote protein, HigA family [Candidatus Desulfarcum epimagneticum]|uniref:Addiction module antidote protein, HigA family n=1 Tax=uncultured Desulfobacteraceae bacterium TaxID=218296 RepID=A0A484HKF5_9BACT|nr:Addiction module antidote protein, HigA family [uncultured Desulfobacteraceae bacterium]
MVAQKIPPIHPGEILMEEFLKPMGLSQNKIALDIRVPPRRVHEIILGKRRITPDTALRLAKYFHMSPQFRLGLQMDYDLDVAEDLFSEKINQEVREYRKAV